MTTFSYLSTRMRKRIGISYLAAVKKIFRQKDFDLGPHRFQVKEINLSRYYIFWHSALKFLRIFFREIKVRNFRTSHGFLWIRKRRLLLPIFKALHPFYLKTKIQSILILYFKSELLKLFMGWGPFGGSSCFFILKLQRNL